MRVLHTSDLHLYDMRDLLRIMEKMRDFDAWIDTGDFFPNCPGNRARITSKEGNIPFQNAALDKFIKFGLMDWLGDRPLIAVPGNHDFISLADELRKRGFKNAHEINTDGQVILGRRFAGFPNIPYIQGEWMYETHKSYFGILAGKVLETNPEILLLHAPINGVLDSVGWGHKGMPFLGHSLMYQETSVSAVFCGHVHLEGGKSETLGDIRFFNGAGKALIHEI